MAYGFNNDKSKVEIYSKTEVDSEIGNVNDRISQIITSPAPTEQEIIDARLGADGTNYPSLGDAIRDQVSDLKADIDYISDSVLAVADEKWCAGTSNNGYTTSTFSGFATSWDITEDKYVKSLKFYVYSRAETNITEIRVRIESGDFEFEKSISVDIGNNNNTFTEVVFPVDEIVPSGTVWIGIACNKQCTIQQADDGTVYHYTYWVNGDMDHLYMLKQDEQPYGSARKLWIIAECREGINAVVGTDEILDGAVTIPKTDFLTIEKRNNLIDPEICKVGYWFDVLNSSAPNPLARISTSQYTSQYCAVVVPVEGLDAITVSSIVANARYYCWLATEEIPTVDNPVPIVSWSGYDWVSLPNTIQVPSGAKYILLSVNGANSNIAGIMANEGSTALPYEPYEENYYLNGKKLLFDESESKNTPSIEVPDSYALVVGDTFQLFYKGIVKSVHPENLEIVAECSKGSSFERYFEITPTVAETLTLTLRLYDNSHNLLDAKNVSLVVSAKATSPSSQKNILCVGDSLTVGGSWVVELHRRLTGSGGTPEGDGLSNLNFIGTRQINGVGFEGYGGWRFSNYNTASVDDNAKIITTTHDKVAAEDQHSIYMDGNGRTWKLETIEANQIKILSVSVGGGNLPASGTLTWVSGGTNHSNIVYTASANAPGNPFWDDNTNKVDFAEYADGFNIDSIDYVYVLLGWNNAGTSEADYKADAQIFIDNVHADFPNAKIVLMGLQVPARDGLGVNYGASGTYSKYWELLNYVFNHDKWCADLADVNTNVSWFNVSGQFDTEYNMPSISKAVNTRNSQTVNMQSNGVHPANSGYMQIADAAYRDITAKL